MKRLKITVIVFAVAFISAGRTLVEQSFAVEPDDLNAVVDTAATLPCKVTDLAGQLQWTKDDFALGTNRNLSYHGYPRYAMTGTDGNGEYNLRLNPVTLDDEGVYQCQVGTGKRDEPAIRSKKATLTVLVPLERPRILQGVSIVTTENIPLELECVSEGGKPPAEINWTDGSGDEIVDDIKTYIEAMATDSRRFTTKSVLKIIPKMEHHNTSITCHAQNAAVDKKLQTKIHLNVKFAPKISLTVAGPVKKMVEGSDVRMLCLTKANPPEVTYRWFVNDQFALGEVTSELWLMNISRRLHNSHVRCEAQNSVDKIEESKALIILYKPQFKSRPKNVQADPGSSVTIVCDIDSNPPASIEWTFERTKKVMSTSSNLTVLVSAATAGRYHCKATTAGFGEVNAEVTVSMKGAPAINSPLVQYGTPADTVRLECVATSVPVAEKIVWTYHGTVIGTQTDQSYYSVLEDPIDDGVKSTLIIRNSREEQFGAYNCTASNYYGSDSIEIVLVPKRDIVLILAIIGAVGGIIVMIMIFIVVGFCRRSTSQKKKKAKTDYGGESDTDNKHSATAKDSDVSSNVSDIKMETGTGSSLSNYRYKIDYGGVDSTMTIATTVDDQRRSITPKSGCSGGSPTVLSRGIPLAGPVPVDPRYASAGYQRNAVHHPLSNGAVNDYADPINYVRYNNASDRPTSSNGYITADRLYDLNPAMSPPPPPPPMTTSCASLKLSADTVSNGGHGLPPMRNGGVVGNGDPATLLQYSAAYGNPYLRPNSAQWQVVQPVHKIQPASHHGDGLVEPPPYSVSVQRGKRKNAAVGQTVSAVGPNYHIGVAKRQTLATHV